MEGVSNMKRSYLLKLALKNITTHRLRSVLTTMGVTIAVGFVVFLISLGYGLQRISTQEIANLEALQVIDVTPGKSKIVKLEDETIEKFTRLSNVDTALVQANMVGKMSYKTSTSESVIYGKNVEFLAIEENSIDRGDIYTSNQADEMMINKSALKQIGVNDSTKAIGEKIHLVITINPEFTDKEESYIKEGDFKIVGVLANESSPYVYIPLEKFKSYGVNKYSAAKVKVTDKKYTDGTKKQLENLGFKTATLKDTVDQINQFFQIFQLILLTFGAVAVAVAALGMFNTLTISLLEKTREISFMKVLGTTSSDIWRLFLSEAIIIGIIGSSLGVLGGMLLGAGLNNFIFDLAQKTGNKPVQIFYTPLVFVFVIFLVTLFLSVLTGIYPSWRASRIDPLEAMRYE